jgi:hypothetical protein
MRIETRKPNHTKATARAARLAEQYRTTDQNSEAGRGILAAYDRIVERLGYDPIN